jgi:hypothetical protein
MAEGFNSAWRNYEENEDGKRYEPDNTIVTISWHTIISECEDTNTFDSDDDSVNSSWHSLCTEYFAHDGMNKEVCDLLSMEETKSEKEMHHEDFHIFDFSEILLAEDSMPKTYNFNR